MDVRKCVSNYCRQYIPRSSFDRAQSIVVSAELIIKQFTLLERCQDKIPQDFVSDDKNIILGKTASYEARKRPVLLTHTGLLLYARKVYTENLRVGQRALLPKFYIRTYVWNRMKWDL